MLLLALLPAVAFATDYHEYNGRLNFEYDSCDAYCHLLNPYSFTFTKYACPMGGPRPEQGGFLSDECDQDDLTITFVNKNDQEVVRQTNIEEAMMWCGNDNIVVKPNGSQWWSPDYKYRQAVAQCRDGYSNGEGWHGADNDQLDPNATFEDVSYTECLQAAYDECVRLEPTPQGCIENQDEAYQCLFCRDCATNEARKTCYTHLNIYNDAALSCFDDDAHRGYQACLRQADKVYKAEIRERDAICEKTFIIEKSGIPCPGSASFGFVSCCCQVKGMMITHPPEYNLVCEDQHDLVTCQTWQQLGYCDPLSSKYEKMRVECPGTCSPECQADRDPCPTQPGTHSTSEMDEECMCTDAMDAQMTLFSSFDEYTLLVGALTDSKLCKSLSGKYKNNSCRPASKSKKVKCAKASNNKAACRALGCDLSMMVNSDGDLVWECFGKPQVF